jgi:hypothetical protein
MVEIWVLFKLKSLIEDEMLNQEGKVGKVGIGGVGWLMRTARELI